MWRTCVPRPRACRSPAALPTLWRMPDGEHSIEEQVAAPTASLKKIVIVLTFVTACDRGRERTNVVTGDGQPEVTVMDFSAPFFSLDPLPAGCYHRTFWHRWPMQTAFAVKDGVPALRFETRSTAPMLFRHVELDLAASQLIIW